MPEHKATKPKSLRSSPRYWHWVASLGFLAVTSAGGVWFAGLAAHEPAVRAHAGVASETTVTTEIGEHGSIDLPDGTRLLLNTDTRVRANRASRRVLVEQGEVIADMEPSADVREYSNTPLVIHVAGVDVEATAAAQLRVRLDRDGAVIVDVIAGATVIRPMSPQQVVDVIAGQTARIEPGEVIVVSAFEPSRLRRELSWQDGEVCLEGQTLREAIEEFNRYNRQKLVVMDETLARRRVGGRFETTDVEGFVDALRHLYGVRVLAFRSGGRGGSTLVLLPADQDA